MFAILRARYQRHTTFVAMFALAVAFRLLAVFLFRPGGYIADAGDFAFYALWGEQMPKGYETFVNLWTAYPPLFPAIMLPIFEWSSRIPLWDHPLLFFQLLFGLLLLIFESGNLLLIYRLALKLGYPPLGYSPLGNTNYQLPITNHPFLLHPFIFYMLLFTPVYTLLGWFEAMPLFFMLWGLDLLLSKQRGGWIGSAVIAALGFLTKLTPALLVPIAVRWLGSKLSWQALRTEWFNPKSSANLLRPTIYVMLFFGVIVGGGYWLVGGHTALAFSSFQVNAIRPPWESIWALIEGNYDWGRVPVDMRNLVGLEQPQRETTLHWGWITVIFGLLYLWLYTRRYDWGSPRTPVVFAAVSVLWLFLYSKGWSPQFLAWILAFIVLLLPNWQGIALGAGLSVLNVIESPIFFTMFGNERWMLTGVILLRTALLVALFVELLGQIWPSSTRSHQLRQIAAAATWLLLLTTVVSIGLGLPRAAQAYTAQRLAAHPCRDTIDYLQTETAWPNRQILSDQIEIWRDLYPWLRQSYDIHIIDGYDPYDRPWDEMIADRLDARIGTDEFWWVTYAEPYTEQATRSDFYFDQSTVHRLDEQKLGACTVTRVKRVAKTPIAIAQIDDGPIQLAALALAPVNMDNEVGRELHLVIYWQGITPVAESYTVFVHLLDEAGQLVAQKDNLPVEGLAPTDTWQPKALIRDPYRLAIPANNGPGNYQLHIGLYTADGRVPLTMADGTSTDHATYNIELQ